MGFLKNNYKILYEKAKAGFATKGLPNDDTSSKVTLYADGDSSKEIHLSDYKLVYDKSGVVYGSTSHIPTSEDVQISGLDENNDVVFGREVIPPTPTKKYMVSVSDDSIEYRSVKGIGQYASGVSVEVLFSIDHHFDIEHINADKELSDLVVTSGTSETDGNWVKATFTMIEDDVVLTLSADPIIKLSTTVPYKSLEGYNKSYVPGTRDIYIVIRGIDDNYDYIATGIDATETERPFNYQGKLYEMGEEVGYEIEVSEMPETDLTIDFRIEG